MVTMGNHRAQAQFDRAKWRFMVLLPCWIVQLVLTMTMMGLFAWRLGDTMKTYDDQDKKGGLPVIEVVWEVVNIVFSFVATLCTFFEIAKYYAEVLTPWTMLFTHVIKVTCAIAILGLDAAVYAQRKDRHYSVVGLGLDVVFIFTAIILVLYSIHTYRRLSKYDDYAHPVNVKPFGFNDDLERDMAYSNKFGSDTRPPLDKRFSSASSRLSMASIRRSFSDAPHPQQPVPLQTVERTPSQYSHERDTQFDEYVARRSSLNANNRDVERVVSGDFSWSSSPTDQMGEGIPGGRPRGTSMPRAPSWASDRGLVAVPEEEEADKYDKDKASMHRESLLGDSRRESMEVPSINEPAVPQEADVADPKWQHQ